MIFLVGLNSILKEAWTMSQEDDSVKSDKIKALALAKECYAMKLELLTNATVVDDAIRFVASHVALPKTVENANSYNSLTLNEESVDVQGTKEDRNTSQQQPTATNNSIF
jgi:hypothetical protein